MADKIWYDADSFCIDCQISYIGSHSCKPEGTKVRDMELSNKSKKDNNTKEK